MSLTQRGGTSDDSPAHVRCASVASPRVATWRCERHGPSGIDASPVHLRAASRNRGLRCDQGRLRSRWGRSACGARSVFRTALSRARRRSGESNDVVRRDASPAGRPTHHAGERAARMDSSTVSLRETVYQGPLPPAAEMERYAAIDPNAVTIILGNFNEQSRHRRELEATVVIGTERRAGRGQLLAAGSSRLASLVASSSQLRGTRRCPARG